MYKEIITKIKELGLDEKTSNELFNTISEEIVDIMLQELAQTTSDHELQALHQRLQNAKSTEHYETILKEISVTVYGDNALEELKKMFLQYIEEIKNTITESKDLLEKYKQGDPEAIALVEKAQQSDTYKSITQTPE
ncbi:hypothetical protein K8R14_03375 [bacterium]|nr:hypothetical protein [bacterium]